MVFSHSGVPRDGGLVWGAGMVAFPSGLGYVKKEEHEPGDDPKGPKSQICRQQKPGPPRLSGRWAVLATVVRENPRELI